MTSIVKIVAVVMVVGVLCVGTVALAEDFVWDANSVQTSWLTPAHWDLDDSYPQNDNDNATIDDAGNLCTFDPGSGNLLFANRVTVAGDSPTKRKLHFKNGTLVANEMVLQDYAELDVDADVAVLEHMELSKNVWIDVANGVDFSAYASSPTHDHAAIHVTSTLAILHLSGEGTFFVAGIEIDANEGSRSLKLNGGTLVIAPYSDIAIISDPDVDNQRAKFWLASGTINWNAASYVEMVGGDRIERRAELDLDQTTCLYRSDIDYAPGYTMIDGYASIDLAAGKQFAMQRLTIGESGAATVVKLTAGSGAVMNVDTADDCP